MTDLVQRLRGNGGTVDIPDIMHEAADEIERLRLLVGVKCTEDVAREPMKVALTVLCAARGAITAWHPNMMKDFDCAIYGLRATLESPAPPVIAEPKPILAEKRTER